MSAIEFAAQLSKALQFKLPSTLIFDYPSLPSMVQHIHIQLGSSPARPELTMPLGLPTSLGNVQPESAPLVSISVSSRLPTNMPCFDAAGSDAIGAVPFSRWDLEHVKVRRLVLQNVGMVLRPSCLSCTYYLGCNLRGLPAVD